jgi:hypothetical protein
MNKVEPSLATQALMGAVTAHHFLFLLFADKGPQDPNEQQALSAYAILWLNGLLAAIGGSGLPFAETSIPL